MSDQVPTNAAAVKVAIRSRPLNERERSTGQTNAWVIQGDTIYLPGNDSKPAQGTFYTFGGAYTMIDESLGGRPLKRVGTPTLR